MIDQHTRDNAFSAVLGEDYDLLKFSYPHHDEFQAVVAEQVRQHFASDNIHVVKILEGGVGSGVTTSFLLAAEQRAHVFAVDSARAMLAQASSLLADYEQRVELIEDDLLEYIRQQPDQSFDAFVSVWTLHNLRPEYRKDLYAEICRTVRRGGIFVAGDKYTVEDTAQHRRQLEVQLNRFRGFPTHNKTLVQAWIDHNLEDEEIRISEKEQQAILENLGFTSIKTVYRKDMEAVIVGVAR